MTSEEQAAVRKTLDGVYGSWHQCRLRESEMLPADYARGLKAGTLCDDCAQMIDAHMRDLTSPPVDASEQQLWEQA